MEYKKSLTVIIMFWKSQFMSSHQYGCSIQWPLNSTGIWLRWVLGKKGIYLGLYMHFRKAFAFKHLCSPPQKNPTIHPGYFITDCCLMHLPQNKVMKESVASSDSRNLLPVLFILLDALSCQLVSWNLFIPFLWSPEQLLIYAIHNTHLTYLKITRPIALKCS